MSFKANPQVSMPINLVTSGAETDTATREKDEKNQVILKKYSPLTDCISEINNAQVHNAKYLHVVMPLFNLMEYSKNYLKISGSLW